MFTVLIPKIQTKTSKLVDKKTGAFLEEQTVLIVHPEQFTPVASSVLLEGSKTPYPVGRYELGSESISPGEYGRAAFRLVIGKKLDTPATKAA